MALSSMSNAAPRVTFSTQHPVLTPSMFPCQVHAERDDAGQCRVHRVHYQQRGTRRSPVVFFLFVCQLCWFAYVVAGTHPVNAFELAFELVGTAQRVPGVVNTEVNMEIRNFPFKGSRDTSKLAIMAYVATSNHGAQLTPGKADFTLEVQSGGHQGQFSWKPSVKT